MTPLLTREQAAAALNVSARWLSDYLKTIEPCWFKAGHRILFDEAAIATIKESMRCRTNSYRQTPRAGRHISAFAGRSSGSTLTEALRLASGGKLSRF
jgi:hypothetical protein